MRADAGTRDAIVRVRTPVPAAVSNTSRASVLAMRSARPIAYESKIRGTKYRSYISGTDPANILSVATIEVLRQRAQTGQHGTTCVVRCCLETNLGLSTGR